MYEQLDIFDMTLPKFQINKPIRLIELFAGIGSQAMALRDLGANFEHYRVVEFDKFAVASYNAIHGTQFEPADITQISGTDLGITGTNKYCYIMTYSFPCQDLSVAGKQKGMTKGNGTRSGLLWEVERLLNEVENLPQVLLMENVPQVHSQANMPDFQKWISFLESKGYTSYWQDLNAKDYGVAQNRSRCFMISMLGKWNYKFPQPIPLKKTMKDYLEDEVDEKYYINTEKAQKLIKQLIDNKTLREGTEYANYNTFEKYSDIARCIQSRDYKGFGGSTQTQNAVIDKMPIDLSVNEPNKKTVSNCITSRDRSISNQKSVGNGVIECKKLK
ncbi:MAG: DNA (cytosine-5-)-methyltransferase [Lachnospiraceae bacterium]|nr:DNA (cytosine-5-)-methyltransferase [Lachnospiraceae bacterium]